MSIKCLLVLLGVTATLFCVANADVTVSDCDHSAPVKLTSLAINPGGYIPLAGGDRTVSGLIEVNTAILVKKVKVKVANAKVFITIFPIDLCKEVKFKALCDIGLDVTCPGFQKLLDVNNVCDDSGNFIPGPHSITSPSIPVPSLPIPSSLSGTVSATIEILVGSTRIGCTAFSIPIHN